MPALLTQGLLKDHPFMEGCSSNFLNHLEEFSKEVSFKVGDPILNEGEIADRCYLILKGRVLLEASTALHSTTVIQVLGPGDTLGWSWLYPPFRWHFSARVLEACKAIELNAAALLIRAEEDPAFGFELMKKVSLQLLNRLQSTRQRLVGEIKCG